MSFGEIYIYSGTPLALDSTQLVALAGLGWSRHTCIPGFMNYRDHFISTIICLIESNLALSCVLP